MIDILKKANKKNIFLIDGLGAIASAFSLGVLLPLLNEWIGMPLQTLYVLGGLAVVFAIYSLSCFFRANHNNPLWLKIIIYVNLSYCVLTASLVVFDYDILKPLGIAYFLIEILIILGVVKLERNVLSKIQ